MHRSVISPTVCSFCSVVLMYDLQPDSNNPVISHDGSIRTGITDL